MMAYYSILTLCVYTSSVLQIMGVMDVVRGSHPHKISVYNINRATVRPTDKSSMYRRMAPFIAGKAEEWVIKDEESNFGMECKAYGFPEPVVIWYKNGYRLSTNYRRYIREGSQILDIRDADPMDTGRYKCLAINPYGMARKEFRVLIMALDPF